MNLDKEAAIAMDAVRKASMISRDIQSKSRYQTLNKTDFSPVTTADFFVQTVICRALGQAFPEDRILAEEESTDLLNKPGFAESLMDTLHARETSDIMFADVADWIDYRGNPDGKRCWILDPIDGTKGFLRGQQYAIALALMVDGRLELGLLGCPNLPYDDQRTGCLFIGRRGHGAEQIFLDDISVREAIHVSGAAIGSELVFVESVESGHTDHGAHGRLYRELGNCRPSVRMDSQAKYAVVARGEVSAYIRTQSKINPRYQKAWDHAAGVLLVQEAGGTATDCDGQVLDFTTGEKLTRNRGVLATNGACHGLVLEMMTDSASE